jgi:hypothetical protein
METQADEESFSFNGTVFPIVAFQVIIDGHCPHSHALRGSERRKNLKSGKQGLSLVPAINSEVFFLKKEHLFLSGPRPASDNFAV